MKISEILKKHGATVQAVALKTGYSRQTIHALGTSKQFQIVREVAEVVGMEPGELLKQLEVKS